MMEKRNTQNQSNYFSNKIVKECVQSPDQHWIHY